MSGVPRGTAHALCWMQIAAACRFAPRREDFPPCPTTRSFRCPRGIARFGLAAKFDEERLGDLAADDAGHRIGLPQQLHDRLGAHVLDQKRNLRQNVVQNTRYFNE